MGKGALCPNLNVFGFLSCRYAYAHDKKSKEYTERLCLLISQTLSITQLTKHHSKQLIPTSEMLHIAVSIILANIVVKLSSVQKSGELGKNVFVLEHNSHLNLTAKLRNQVRFIPKHHLIDCISINSKSD